MKHLVKFNSYDPTWLYLTDQLSAKLDNKEQKIVDDILSLDEAIDFSSAMNKVKRYAKRGLITATILASLLSNNAFSQEQKDQIKDVVKTEQSVQNETISLKDFQKLIKKEGFENTPGSIPANMISGVENVKIYTAVGQTEGAAMKLAMEKAKNPIKSFKFSKTLDNGNIEVLVAVPAK
jgi:virulence-associated protein VapD